MGHVVNEWRSIEVHSTDVKWKLCTTSLSHISLSFQSSWKTSVGLIRTRLQIQGPRLLSATVCLRSSSYTSSSCPPSPSFPSAHDTSPLEYHLGISASSYDFNVTDHHLLDDEWLKGDASTPCSLLYWVVEMQDKYPVASSSTVILDSPPPLLAARLGPIYEPNEDSPPLAKHSKCTCQNQIMALPADHWDEEDLINIYGSGVKNEDDGFVRMCLSVLHSLCPHDSLMAALAPTASICVVAYIRPCNHCGRDKINHVE